MANIVLDFLHNYQTGERRETEPANAYQYDEGHVLEAVLPEVITSCEIHYWIRGMEEADAYEPGSITPNSDGSCTVLGNIPNKYFETNGELRIYIVVTDGTASITTYEGKLHICQRSMPDDYVDDDPENEATRILTEVREAAETASAAAERCEEVLESIPSDYSQLSDDVEAITTATAEDEGKALKAKTVSGGKVVEWEFGATGTGGQLNILYLYGDESEIQTNWQNRDKSKMNFRYVFQNINENKQKNGWCKLSLQGNATLQYPKHNFNIQFYKDAGYRTKDKVDFMDLTDDKHPKWTLKANYNDYSQGRNVVSARLWGDVVHCRSNMSKALSDAPNHGAIDGHPVIIMMNDAYYGLYMFNMSKSDWMIGIDEDNPMHCAVSSNLATNATKWLSTGLSGWELEIPDTWQSPEVDGVVTSVQAGFTALQSFVINSTDADFYEGLSNYLDVPSAIDYLIYSFCVCNADSMNKNQFLVTWDAGKTWAFTAYDMDQTFGAGFTSEIPYNHNLFSTHSNHLFERIIANFYDEIMERYNVLRSSVFSYNYVARELSMFFDEIPSGEREKDKEKYPGMMFQTISTLSKMQEFTLNRLQWCDSFFARLDPSYIPCTALSLSESSLEFNLLTSQQLTATKTPSNASDPVVWSSSDTTVATVSETGLVTAVADGSATITATCGEQTATCTVLVLQIHRGTVDYTIDAASIATWGTGKAYNTGTGALEDVTNEHYTEKFHLQDCLYSLTGGSFSRVYAWDAEGNYQGCSGQSSGKTFSARSDWWYALKSYNRHNDVSLMPIDHSSTEGAGKTVVISSITGDYNATNHYFYNNAVNSQFAGLISSTSGTINFDAVDWVWSDHVVWFKPVSIDATTDSSIEVLITGSGANVEVWLYTQMFTNKADMNSYLAEHPITLVFNLA